MIYRHTDAQIQDYFAKDKVNQTAIKYLLKEGMQAFVRKFQQLMSFEDLYYNENDSFIVGGAADYRISQGEGLFNQKYFFSSLKKKPGDKEMAIIHQVFDIAKNLEKEGEGEVTTLLSTDINSYKKALYNACNSNAYYMNRAKPEANWEEDTRVASILKTGLPQLYWQELCTSIGKQILSDEQKTKVDKITTSWLTHPYTADLFAEKEGVDIIYQMPIYFNINGIDCKILVDMIIVDHNKRTIKIIDLKTMYADVLTFDRVIAERRYDIQADFYMTGVRDQIRQIGLLIGYPTISTYQLLNLAFVVESTGNPGTPLIFPMTDTALKIGREGLQGNYYLREGWMQGISKYQAWATNEWSFEKRIPNGVVFIGENLQYIQNL